MAVPTKVGWSSAAYTNQTAPSVTILTGTDAGATWDPAENDLILTFASSASTVAAPAADPSGWVNLLGVGGELNTAAASHGMVIFRHWVTAAEASASTIIYAPAVFGGNETGNTCVIVVRGVNTTTPINVQASLLGETALTPHVLPGLTGGNQPTTTDCLVVGCVVKDATGTYTDPAGWTLAVSNNTNQGKWLGTRNTGTTAATDVTATNITPSASDEYISFTVALAPAPVPTALVVQDGAHAHVADNVTVEHVIPEPPVDLVIQDGNHAHASLQLAEHYLTPTVGYAETADPGPLPLPNALLMKIRGPVATAWVNSPIISRWPSSTSGAWMYIRASMGDPNGSYRIYPFIGPGTSQWSVKPSPGSSAPQFLAVTSSGPPSSNNRGFISPDGIIWTTSGGIGGGSFHQGLANLAGPLRIGHSNAASQASYPPWDDRIYWVEMRQNTGVSGDMTDPVNGTLLWRFDPSEHVSGTSWVDALGRTWTLSNASAVTHVAAAINVTLQEVAAVNLVVQNAQHNFVNQTDLSAFLNAPVGTASTPDPGLMPTDGFVLVLKSRGPASTAGNNFSPVSQNIAAPQSSWHLARGGSNGNTTLSTFPSGTSSPRNDRPLSAAVAAVDRVNPQYWAVSLVMTTGVSQTYYSTNQGVSYSSITPQTGTATSTFDSTDPVRIGAAATPALAWDDRIYWVELRTGIDPLAGTLLWRFDAAEHISGTSWVDARGKTWTVTSAAAVVHPVTNTPTLTEELGPIPLVVDNGTHAHTAGDVFLDVTFDLVVASATHLHTAAVAQPAVDLVPANATHLHTAVTPQLTLNLIVANAAHLHTAGATVFTLDLVVADAIHAHAAGVADLVVGGVDIFVANGTHAQTAGAVALTPELVPANAQHLQTATTAQPAVDLVVASAQHAQTSTATYVDLNLVAASAQHLHTAVSPTLDIQLVVASAVHAHVAVAPALIIELTVASAVQTQTSSDVVFTSFDLAVASATHGHTATIPPIYEGGFDIVVASPVHVQTVTNVVFVSFDLNVSSAAHAHTATSAQPSVNLTVANAAHLQTATIPVVVIGVELDVASATHLQPVGAPTLSVDLVIASATHLHTATGITTERVFDLVVANAVHGHTSQSATLTLAINLSVASAVHAQTASSAVLGLSVDLVVASAVQAQGSAQLGSEYLVPTMSTARTVDPGPLPNESTLVFKVRGPDPLGVSLQSIVAQYDADPQRSWLLRRNEVNGTYTMTLTSAGTAGTATGRSVAGVTPTQDDEWLAMGMVINDGANACRLSSWTSPDGVTWNPISLNVNAGATVVPLDSTGPVRIGAYTVLGDVWNGRIYSTELRGAIGPTAGNVLWRFDARDIPALPAVRSVLDTDDNSDGVANGWRVFQTGTGVTGTADMFAGRQRFTCQLMGAAPCWYGIETVDTFPAVPGPFVVGLTFQITNTLQVGTNRAVGVACYNAVGGELTQQASAAAAGTPKIAYNYSFTLPAGTASVRVRLYEYVPSTAPTDTASTVWEVWEVGAGSGASYTDPRGLVWSLNNTAAVVHPPVSLGLVFDLEVASATHASSATNVALTQDHNIAVANAVHAQTATDTELVIVGIVILNNALAVYLNGTPVSRIYVGATQVWP